MKSAMPMAGALEGISLAEAAHNLKGAFLDTRRESAASFPAGVTFTTSDQPTPGISFTAASLPAILTAQRSGGPEDPR